MNRFFIFSLAVAVLIAGGFILFQNSVSTAESADDTCVITSSTLSLRVPAGGNSSFRVINCPPIIRWRINNRGDGELTVFKAGNSVYKVSASLDARGSGLLIGQPQGATPAHYVRLPYVITVRKLLE